MRRKIHSIIVSHVVTPLEGNNNMENLNTLVLFYLEKIFSQEGEPTMTLAELQADVQTVNMVLDVLSKFAPGKVNSIVKFLEIADQNPLLLNIILLVVNGMNPAPVPVPPAAMKQFPY